MNKLALRIKKSAEVLKTDTGKAPEMKKKIMAHKKATLLFWKKVGKIQKDEDFLDDYGGGDSEDYEAWAQAADVDDGEDFVYDYIQDDYIENVYKKYGVREAA